MKKSKTVSLDGLVEISPFDFKHSQPNKFTDQYTEQAETIILNSEQEKSVVLEPDVAAYFSDSDSVNAALRSLITAMSHIKNPSLSS